MTGFADRVVEVLCDLGPTAPRRWISSSGLLISGRHVLTAAHAVAPTGAVTVRGVDKVELVATVALVGDVDVADLALLELAEPLDGHAPLRWARIDRDGAETIAGCRGIGYPLFQQVPVRDTAQLDGAVPTGDRRVSDLLTLRVTSSPRALPPQQEALGQSQWSGISGTVVVTADEVMIGVVTEHQPRAGDSALTLTPITHVDRLPDAAAWWDVLGRRPVQLPQRRRRPPYFATVAEIADRTPELRDRSGELADLAAFAVGAEPFRFLVGTPWAGKTALAAHLAVNPPPDVDCVAYLLQRRALDASGSRFLAAVTSQLADLLGEQAPEPDAHALADLWARAVERADDLGRHLLLIVDGLDEDLRPAGERSVASLIPTRRGRHAHVLLTARRDQLPEDVDADHPLWDVLPVRMTQAVEAARVEQRAFTDLDALAADPPARQVLGLLAAAAGPLTITELADLGAGDAYDVGAIVAKQAARVIEGGDDGWRFAHQALLDTCRDTVFGPALAALVETVDTWAGRWSARGWPDGTPRYLLAHYPWALLARAAHARFATLTGDPQWIAAAVAAVGVDAVLGVLRAASATGVPLRLLDIEAHHLRAGGAEQPAGQLALAAAYTGVDDPRWAQAALRRAGLAAEWTSGRASRSLRRSFDTGSRQVWAAAFVTATSVVTGDDDGRVRLWQLDGGHYTDLGRHDAGVHRVAVDQATGSVVTCGNDQTVRLWNLPDGTQRTLARGLGHMWAVAFSPDGRQIATAGRDTTVRLWTRADGPPTVLGTHDDQVRVLAFSPDGSMIVSSGRDSVIRLWWPGTDASEILGSTTPGKWIEAMAVTPDGADVITGSYDGAVRAWPLDGTPRRRLGRHEGQVWAAAVSPDGTFAVTGGGDGRVCLWPLAASAGPERILGRHGEPVRSVSVSPDGTHVVSSAADGIVHIWDLDGAPDSSGQRQSLTAVAVDPAGAVYSGALDGRLRDQAGEIRRLGTGVRALAHDGDRLLALGDDGMIVADGVAYAEHPGARALAVNTAAGFLVAAGGTRGVTIWPLAGGPARQVACLTQIQAVAVNAAGVIVSGASSGSVAIISRDGQARLVLPADRTPPIWSVAITNCYAASGDHHGTIRLWRLGSDATGADIIGSVLAELAGPIGGLAFTEDGTALLSAGEDGLRVWTIPDGRLLGHVRTEPLHALAVHGGTAATLSDQLGLTRWRLDLTKAG